MIPAPTPHATRPHRPVRDGLDTLVESIETLYTRVDLLVEYLAPLMSNNELTPHDSLQIADQGELGEIADQGELGEIAAQIVYANRTVNRITDKLQELADRLQL